MEDYIKIENSEEYNESLIYSLQIILSREILPEYLQNICEIIIEGKSDRTNIQNKIKEFNISTKTAKIEFLDFILLYIDIVLRDNILTQTEIDNVRYLKELFTIREGDFYTIKYDRIKEILKIQLERIYLDDLKIDKNEALYKVDLQELFDLGYDQFCEIENEIAKSAIDKGANIIDLDTFIPDFKQEVNESNEKPFNKRDLTSSASVENEIKTNTLNNSKKIPTSNKYQSNPSPVFWLEIIILSILLYNKSNSIWISILCFIVSAFLIQITIFAFILACAMSVFVGWFVYDLIGIFFNETIQWIGAIITFLGLLSYHYKNNDLNISHIVRSRQIAPSVKKAVWERDGGKCVVCGSTVELEYDHNIPISKGGSNTVNNIRLLCRKCNRSKTDKIDG